jgi:HlyD family secretion protein
VVFPGVALGVAAGVGLGHVMLVSYRPFFRFPDLAYDLPLWAPAGSALLAFASGLGGAIGAVRAVARLRPAEALRPAAPSAYSARFSWTLFRLPARWKIAARGAGQHPRRTGVTLLGLVVAAPLILMGLFWTDALDYVVDVQFAASERADAVVQLVEPLPARVVDEVGRMPGVLLAEPLRYAPVRLRAGHLEYETSLTAFSDRAQLRRLLDDQLNVETVLNEAKTRVRDRYSVTAPIAGILARTILRAGDAVGPSTVIAVISPALAPLEDPRARQQLQERLGAAEAARSRAASVLESARARLAQARADLERTAALADRGVVTASRREHEMLANTLAERELAGAQFAAHMAEHEESLARAALDLSSNRKPESRRLEIASPVTGVVLRIAQDSEGPVAIGSPIMQIGDPGQLEIIADVLTTDAVQIEPGANAVIERWGGIKPLSARVAKVEPGAFTKVSALGIDEQRVFVVLDITSPREEWARLGDAFRVEARIEIARTPDALIIPVGALFRGRSGWSVFVIDNNHARLLSVAVSRRNEAEAAVTSGLLAGERVVVFPPPALRDGALVEARDMQP